MLAPGSGCSPAPPPEPSPGPPAPPIILMVKDALRADRLGCYGYHRPTTPNIDRFAEESVLFERAFSNSPWSASSFMSLFTSLSPEVHGVSNLTSRYRLHPRVSGRIPLLAEILQGRGYLTVGLHGGGNVLAVRGFDRGFEYYGRDFRTANYREVAENIRQWLERSRVEGQPIFLFLHHLICHDPYLYGPSEFRYRFLEDPVPGLPLTIQELDALGPDRAANFWKGVDLDNPRHKAHIDALYDGGVYFSDFVFGELMDVLREEGIYDEALIILTSDHGEALGERGTRGHGALWWEHLHVPLLLKFPGAERGGRKVAVPVGLMDAVPTLLEYLQVKFPDPLQGTSLLPLAAGRGEEGGSPVVSYRAAGSNPYFQLGSIRIMEGDYVLIRHFHRAGNLLDHYLANCQEPDGGGGPDPGKDQAGELIARGDDYFDQDFFGEAREFYRRAVEAAPDNTRARLKLIAALREEQRYPEAEEEARGLIDRDPGTAGAYRELAWIACDQKRFGEGGERFARAAELFPEDPRVYLDWGNCLRRQGRREDMEEKILTALRLAGDDSSLIREFSAAFRWLGKTELAEEMSRRRFEEGPVRPEYVSTLVGRLLEEGKIGEAREFHQAMIRDNPGLVWPYLARADFLGWVGEVDGVEEMIETALEISPGRGWLLRAAGEKYLELGNPIRAARLLAEAAELEPERGYIRLLQAVALRRTGELAAAERVLSDARPLLTEEDRAVSLELAKLYLARGRGREAEEFFARATIDWMGHHALFDWKNDPGETENVFLERPRAAGRMLELERKILREDRTLRRYYRGEGPVPGEPAVMDEEEQAEMQRQLKLLGY